LFRKGFTTGAVTSVNSLLFQDSTGRSFWFDTAGTAVIAQADRHRGATRRVQRVATLTGAR
jgi:hypothetical protein